MVTNRKYKDGVFTDLFGKKDKIIELYNAICGSNYSNETEIEIITLEGVLFQPLKNDLAFLIDEKFVVLMEHQSTLSDNIPLRMFLYLAREYERIVKESTLYKKKRVMIPTPELYVLYNGVEECPEEKILRLSDSFKVSLANKSMELEVKLLNVNYKENSHVKWLEKSKTLYDYSKFIKLIRDYISSGLNRDEAIEQAITDSIKDGILKDYLIQKGSEVYNMLLKEFNIEEALQVRGEEEREEGRQEGAKEKCNELAVSLLDVLDIKTISEKTGLTVEEIEKLKKQY